MYRPVSSGGAVGAGASPKITKFRTDVIGQKLNFDTLKR